MVICPIALAVGCKRCPAFSVCPVKTVIGDYKPEKPEKHEDPPVRKKAGKAAATSKSKPASNRKGARARRPRK
ncbi:MAG: hypothetical protein ABI812_09395 [Betaproteobacteria bacterium]